MNKQKRKGTLHKMLLESTYNLEPLVTRLMKEIVVPFYKDELDDKHSITKKLSDILETKHKVYLTIEKRNPSLAAGEVNAVTDLDKENKEVSIVILRKTPLHTLGDLRHELVHVLDYLRGDLKTKAPNKDYYNSWDGYLLDTYEFNQLIHVIKDLKTKINRKNEFLKPWVIEEWGKVNTSEGFFKFLMKALNKESGEALRKNKKLLKLFLKRLARENLLPPNYRG